MRGNDREMEYNKIDVGLNRQKGMMKMKDMMNKRKINIKVLSNWR